MKRAIVLGGGGPVGWAWEAGLVSMMTSEGVALRSAVAIIGTSAGAIVGAQLALGLDLGLVAQAPPSSSAPPPGAGLRRVGELMARAASSLTPDVERREIGRLAMEAATPTEEHLLRRLSFLAHEEWPDNFLATAVNARTGERVVWRSDSGVSLQRGVASSSSLPTMSPPITIGNDRYIDGGVRSMLNADLAIGCDTVIVVSCWAPSAGVLDEIRDLRASGARVDVIAPDAAFSKLTENGARMLDSSLARDAYELGKAQALEVLTHIDRSWLHVE